MWEQTWTKLLGTVDTHSVHSRYIVSTACATYVSCKTGRARACRARAGAAGAWVARSLTDSLADSLTQSLMHDTHPLTHSLTHSVTHPFARSSHPSSSLGMHGAVLSSVWRDSTKLLRNCVLRGAVVQRGAQALQQWAKTETGGPLYVCAHRRVRSCCRLPANRRRRLTNNRRGGGEGLVEKCWRLQTAGGRLGADTGDWGKNAMSP